MNAIKRSAPCIAILLMLCCVLSTPVYARPVTIHTTRGDVTFDAEIARSKAQRRQGLMHRESLPERGGMLFVYPEEQPVAMWMKNTLIPLDMIFINPQREIIRIKHQALPGDLAPVPSGGPVSYVLELAGGTAAAYHLRAGNRVTIPLSQPEHQAEAGKGAE